MAKGSLFWGKAAGKLGEVVLSTLKGQQISRAYQAKVANPATSTQTEQRAKFANAVKFYKRSQQNLFKFAFEDKKQTESDYNAFMRHNVEQTMIANKASYSLSGYPAIANRWMLSFGSLPSADMHSGDVPSFTLDVTSAEPKNVANLSQSLVSKYNLVEGDIVTFITIISTANDIDSEPTTEPIWGIVQFVISTTDTTLITDLFTEQSKGNNKKQPAITLAADESMITFSAPSDPSYPSTMFGVIFSRKTTAGLKVSTSYLYNNSVFNKMYSDSLQYAYRSAALNSWGRKETAILEGSVANPE